MIRDLIALSRPAYSLMLTWPYLLTVYYARGAQLRPSTDLASAAALSLVLAGGYILNDIIDIPIDRLRRVRRPLAHGDLSVASAAVAAGACILCGLAVACACASTAFAIALLSVTGGLVLYDLTSKRIGIWKDVVVAALMTSIYGLAAAQTGGYTGSRAMTLPFFACWMFVSAGAFELLSDIGDRKVDRGAGRGPAMIQRRPIAFLRVSNALMVIGGIILLLPAAAGAGLLYQIAMPLCTAAIIALFVSSSRPASKLRLVYLQFVCVGIVTTLDVMLYP